MSVVARLTDLSIGPDTGPPVVESVSIALARGTVTALIGPSGSGKTTLAHALLGYVPRGLTVHSGRVEVDGHDPFSASGRRLVRGRVAAMVPQDPGSALDPMRSVLHQLQTAAAIAMPGASRGERRARVHDAIARAALDEHVLELLPSALSGGQAQRALVAWVCTARPELVILDEPTSGLDAATAARVTAAFTTLPWSPAVLVITHDRVLADQHVERVLEIRDRRVQATAHAAKGSIRPGSAGADAAIITGTPALRAEHVTIRRGSRVVLRDASLTLAEGEWLAVRGTSGSGKTSFVRALAGLAPPASGSLTIAGHAVPWPASQRAAARMPYVAYAGQDALAALPAHERAHRTIARALASGIRRGRPRYRDVAQVAMLVGLPQSVLERRPAELSGGQRHRLVLAGALAAAPDVLLCDETTAALDAASTAAILDALDHARRMTGLALISVTHQQAVLDRADRTLTIDDGRLR